MSPPLRYRPRIVVALRSPFILAGVEAGGVGIDTPALRDEAGDAVLPGDHLKGLVREALMALQTDADKIDWLLGTESAAERAARTGVTANGDSNAPQRGRLRLRDLTAKTMRFPKLGDPDVFVDPDDFEATIRKIADWRETARLGEAEDEGRPDITRIRLDPETGAVEPGMLQVVELAAPLSALAMFEGEALFHGDDSEARASEKLLARALSIIPYFGGLRSVGFGEHLPDCSRIDFGVGAPILAAAAGAPPLSAALEGEFDSAFLVSAERLADNVYEGAAVIPGAAIKGALAEMLEAAGRDPSGATPTGRALAALRISHARPLHVVRDRKGERLVARCDAAGHVALFEAGRVLPLSLMRDQKTGDFACAARHATPGVMSGLRADFQPDWKPDWFGKARDLAGRPDAALDTISRGHTAIDRMTGGAETGRLFVEAIRSHRHDTRSDVGVDEAPADEACRFRFRIGFPKDFDKAPAEDLAAAAEIVATLSRGVDALGKTHSAFATRVVTEAAPPQVDRVLGRWTVMLETDALLLDMGSVDPAMDVGAALAAYWSHVCPGAVLERRFVRRCLFGGYLGMRRRAGATYRPWPLFVAGGVFEITAAQKDVTLVADALERLRRDGLPALQMRGGALHELIDWRACPFLPQNGFGEISVDAPFFHAFRKASAGGSA
jgi:hypothetical protein